MLGYLRTGDYLDECYERLCSSVPKEEEKQDAFRDEKKCTKSVRSRREDNSDARIVSAPERWKSTERDPPSDGNPSKSEAFPRGGSEAKGPILAGK